MRGLFSLIMVGMMMSHGAGHSIAGASSPAGTIPAAVSAAISAPRLFSMPFSQGQSLTLAAMSYGDGVSRRQP